MSNALVYKGNCGWQQIAPTKWSVASYGCDRAICLYKGRADQKDSFQSQQVRFQAYSVDGALGQTMWLEDWTDTGGSVVLPETEYHFVGFRQGTIPAAKVVYGTSAQTFSSSVQYPQSGLGSNAATTNGATTTDTFTGNFTYKAARATWSWWSLTSPGSTPPPGYSTIPPPFNVFPLTPSNMIGSIEDTSWSSGAAQGQPAPIPVGVLAALINTAYAGYYISDYSVDVVVPGKLFHCMSVVDYKVLAVASQ